MTSVEIKKAWDKMKKGIEKECGFSGGFTMSQAQIKKGTATILVCNDIPYEKEIYRLIKADKEVQGYEGWTEKEKIESHERHMADIERKQERLQRYGSKENEFHTKMSAIKSSEAFKAFCKNFEYVEMTSEHKDIYYYIRINYSGTANTAKTVKVTDDMISEVHCFNNCGQCIVTIEGVRYQVVWDHGTVKADKSILDAMKEYIYG